jgi:hypothetical protein
VEQARAGGEAGGQLPVSRPAAAVYHAPSEEAIDRGAGAASLEGAGVTQQPAGAGGISMLAGLLMGRGRPQVGGTGLTRACLPHGNT